MASLREIKEQIIAANDIGRVNLAEKGVTLPGTATTCEIMESIEKVVQNTEESPGEPIGVVQTTIESTFGVISPCRITTVNKPKIEVYHSGIIIKEQ